MIVGIGNLFVSYIFYDMWNVFYLFHWHHLLIYNCIKIGLLKFMVFFFFFIIFLFSLYFVRKKNISEKKITAKKKKLSHISSMNFLLFWGYIFYCVVTEFITLHFLYIHFLYILLFEGPNKINKQNL